MFGYRSASRLNYGGGDYTGSKARKMRKLGYRLKTVVGYKGWPDLRWVKTKKRVRRSSQRFLGIF